MFSNEQNEGVDAKQPIQLKGRWNRSRPPQVAGET